MRINVVCEVIAYASLLQAKRGLGGPHNDGEEPCLRLFQQLVLHQQHSNTTSWNFGVKKFERSSVATNMVSTRAARSAASHHMQRSACGGAARRYVGDKVLQGR